MILETERLQLRPYAEGDRDAFVALNSDPIVRKYMEALSADAAAQLFERCLPHHEHGVAWAVIHKPSSAYIGHVFISGGSADAVPELGFLFFAEYWGQGFATEATTCVVEHFVAQTKGGDLIAMTDLDHDAARQVLEKVGLQLLALRTDEQGPFCVYALENGDGELNSSTSSEY